MFNRVPDRRVGEEMAVGLCEALPLQGSFSIRECRFFLNRFNRNKTLYLEYGCGVSTLIAGLRAKKAISIEGSLEWYQNTSKLLQHYKLDKTVELRHANIGPTAWLSYPIFNNATAHNYCIKSLKADELFDLILIDGRFRVACAAHAYHRLNHKGTLLVHDYRGRHHYSDINKLFTLTGFVQTLAAFKPRPNRSPRPIYVKHFHDAA